MSSLININVQDWVYCSPPRSLVVTLVDVLAILFRPFGIPVPKLDYLAWQSFDYEHG